MQAVGDGEDSAVRKLFADGGLNQVVRLQVDGCCGLIQDQDARLPQQGSGQTQKLPLSNAVKGMTRSKKCGFRRKIKKHKRAPVGIHLILLTLQ